MLDRAPSPGAGRGGGRSGSVPLRFDGAPRDFEMCDHQLPTSGARVRPYPVEPGVACLRVAGRGSESPGERGWSPALPR